MKQLDEFRIYYNHTIHPELMRMERKRLRLLRLFVFSAILVSAVLILGLIIDILVVTLFLLIPIGFYMAYLLYRLRQFILTFKPNVINLILDFVDDSINYGSLKYTAKKKIPKEIFFKSKIFKTDAPYYAGEDFIKGKIGSLDFELCELEVKEFSPVRNRLNYVFKGVFLAAKFNAPIKGKVVVWPKKFRQYLTRSIKAFTWERGFDASYEILNKKFAKQFMVYATPHTHVVRLVTEDMQKAILKYQKKIGKEIYFSILNQEIFIAITEPKDILEPHIFQSNLSFELVREFFEDIYMILNILEIFDRSH